MASLDVLEISIKLLPLFKGRTSANAAPGEAAPAARSATKKVKRTGRSRDKGDSSPQALAHRSIDRDGWELRVRDQVQDLTCASIFIPETADPGGQPRPLVAKGEGRYRDGELS